MSTKNDLYNCDSTANTLVHHCFSLSGLRMRAENRLAQEKHDIPGQAGELSIDCSRLSGQSALDLANCLPFLACGEESAVHAFSHSLLKDIQPQEAEQMQTIAEDELRHARYLESLRRELPAPSIHLPLDAMSRFFRRLLTKNSARHFAQVAALDLNVCRLLAPLLHPRAGLKNAAQVREMLGALTRDEARHVKVARDMALKLGITPLAMAEIDRNIELQLAVLLAPIHASLDRLAEQSQDRGFELVMTPPSSLDSSNGRPHL